MMRGPYMWNADQLRLCLENMAYEDVLWKERLDKEEAEYLGAIARNGSLFAKVMRAIFYIREPVLPPPWYPYGRAFLDEDRKIVARYSAALAATPDGEKIPVHWRDNPLLHVQWNCGRKKALEAPPRPRPSREWGVWL